MPHILITDDDTELRNLLTAHLESAGHTVTAAGDGKAAMAAMAAKSPDLIIMDMNMPGMTGWEAVREIKAASSPPPVIGLSAHATAGDKDEAYEAGCDLYLEKPVTPEQLLEAIKAVLNQG